MNHLLRIKFISKFCLLPSLHVVEGLHLHSNRPHIAEKDVIGTFGLQFDNFAETVGHEIDVLKCPPGHLTTVLEKSHVNSS